MAPREVKGLFADRVEAGRRLAERLSGLRGQDAVVLGLPRGGLPVGFEVARALDAPLDVLVVRKLGVPFQPELALGAIGEGGVRVLQPSVLGLASIGAEELARLEAAKRAELRRRAARYRENRPGVSLKGRLAVVVDDGVATGSTARAACQVARARGASRVVLAVPVAPPATVAALGRDAEVICLETPENFRAVGEWYRDFSQVSDEEVTSLLRRARGRFGLGGAGTNRPGDRMIRDEEVQVTAGEVRLGGHLSVPEDAHGLVVFVHGSGSSRHSPRNQFVAQVLQQDGLATLLFDLLTPGEEVRRATVFDIELLTARLRAVTEWARRQAGVPLGYFGASTGAAAALSAAAAADKTAAAATDKTGAEPDSSIAAIVSRGGRPDLAGSRLRQVRAPTLLIVGGRDEEVIELNVQAQAQLRCKNHLVVVPGATHLFEEPGALAKVAELASEWFRDHLRPGPTPAAGGCAGRLRSAQSLTHPGRTRPAS